MQLILGMKDDVGRLKVASYENAWEDNGKEQAVLHLYNSLPVFFNVGQRPSPMHSSSRKE